MAIVSGVINGVAVDELREKIGRLQREPAQAQFRFKVTNHWIDGGHNRTTVHPFVAGGNTIEHARAFRLEADEPPTLLGQDKGANPVEHLLNALAGCLTSAMVYHAAARGITVDDVESTIEGDIDVRGFMGISDEVRKGYQNIRVTFRVKSDAPPEKLRELAEFSPVFDTVTNGTNVELVIETK